MMISDSSLGASPVSVESPSAVPDNMDQYGDSADFQVTHAIHALKHYLPAQAPLKDFIHHNSLHAYQHMPFYEAIFKAAGIFGYQVTLQLSEYRQLFTDGRIQENILDQVVIAKKGAEATDLWKKRMISTHYDSAVSPRIGQLRGQWKTLYNIDLDNQVHPTLFRLLCSYLDQGVALWKFPGAQKGFLEALRALEKKSFVSLFKTRRARKWLLEGDCSVHSLLNLVVGNESLFERYLFDQQFAHQGWSGMVSAIEDNPKSLLDGRAISLHDLIVFELLLEIDALDNTLGTTWKALGEQAKAPAEPLLAAVSGQEIHEVLALWQDAFEWSYYDSVLSGIQQDQERPPTAPTQISFQAMFCIDERECSLRRYIEQVDPNCETLGTPGFFGVEFYFQPDGGQFYDKLCPAPVTPKYLIKESGLKQTRPHDWLYTNQTHTFIGGTISAFSLGFAALFRLISNLFRPKMSPAISNAFAHAHAHARLSIENQHPEDCESGLQIGFTVAEMSTRVAAQLRSIGLVKHFAPIVYVIAHGSSSANNPHHGAHDCGACSGRPGSVNARVLAFMANHPKVREQLHTNGIDIPPGTQFVGGLHDTAADEIEFYDVEILTPDNQKRHVAHQIAFEKALDLNAKERSRRFASIATTMDIRNIRKAIKDRSVSLFEPRPELGHGTNTLCIVGRRALTKGLFLDRRAFLNSYDYRTDPTGALLLNIMKPLGPVCGGINLEYYFSRVDNYKLGAGTKLPHNVMGLIGVANSCDGDLRPGLPVQMIEVHDPVRLLIIVEHFPEIILKNIQSIPEMYEWYINEWVRLVAIHPETKAFYLFKAGAFQHYQPISGDIATIQDIPALIEQAPEMATNQIADATRENLPVYLLK